MDKLNALGSNYADYQTAVEGAPQFEADTRATVFGQDQGVKDLMGGFSDKVMELYNYDKNKASAYSAPVNVQGTNYVANPMIAESATQTGFNQIAREKENAWQLYETRKNLLGSVVDKALKLYEAKLEGKKVGLAAAERDLNTTIDLFKESNRMKEDDRNYLLELAKLNKKSGTGLTNLSAEDLVSLDLDNVGDEDVVALAKDIYGPNVKLGSISQAPAYARKLVDNYRKIGADPKVLESTMDAATSAAFRDSIKFYKDAQEALTGLQSQTLAGSVTEGTTGPLAALFGPAYQDATSKPTKTRQLLGQMKAEKIKEFYGGAFTATEMKNAGWIVGPQRQESTNIAALNSMIDSAEKKMRAALTLQGITGPKQDEVISKLVGGSAKPPLSSFDK